MYIKKIPLRADDESVYLEAYIADPLHNYTRSAILVIPGGGYGTVCADREGEPIAQAFMAQGYNAFVLHYTVGGKRIFPAQLIEASLAIAHIRENAAEYGIDPARVFAVGFSAGGHLAGSLGVLWDLPEVYEGTGIAPDTNRPDGVMLIYPVVTAVEAFSHVGSFFNLFGTRELTDEMRRAASLELHVTASAAPLFLLHTSTDQVVDVRHSLVLAAAYREAGIPFELHIYPDAPHGIALGSDITNNGVPKYSNPAFSGWVDRAAAWAKSV